MVVSSDGASAALTIAAAVDAFWTDALASPNRLRSYRTG